MAAKPHPNPPDSDQKSRRPEGSLAGNTGGASHFSPIPASKLAGAILSGLLIFAVVAWGGSFVAARMVLSPVDPTSVKLSPTLLAATRFLIATILFLPLLIVETRRGRGIRRADLPLFFFIGQIGISIYFWLQYTGVSLTSAGLSAVLVVGLIPLSTLLISRAILKEGLSRRQTLALVLGLVGLLVVVSGGYEVGIGLDGQYLFGAACLIANALCFGLYSSLVRGIRERYPPGVLTSGIMASGALGLLAMSALYDDWSLLLRLSKGQWWAIVYLAAGCSVVAYFGYNYALSKIEAARAAAWLYLEPPVALILGAILISEPIEPLTVIGGAIILASLVLLQRKG